MNHSTDRLTLTFPGTDVPVGFVESATIEYAGHKFTNQGAYVSPTHLTAYLRGATVVPAPNQAPTSGTYPHPGAYHVTADGQTLASPAPIFAYRSVNGTNVYEPRFGAVTTWSGEPIGEYHVTGTSYGFHGTRLYHVEIRLTSGAVYVGKGTGTGMLIRARRSARQYVPLDSPQARRRMPWRYAA